VNVGGLKSRELRTLVGLGRNAKVLSELAANGRSRVESEYTADVYIRRRTEICHDLSRWGDQKILQSSPDLQGGLLSCNR